MFFSKKYDALFSLSKCLEGEARAWCFSIFAATRQEGYMAATNLMFCLSHALTPDHESTDSIEAQRREQNVQWALVDEAHIGLIDWLRFTVQPPDGLKVQPVEVRFKILPIMGGPFMKAPKSRRFSWVVEAMWKIVAEAKADGAEHITIALGAFTKNATRHGLDLVEYVSNYPDLKDYVTFNHGDYGSVDVTEQMIREARIPEGFTVAVLGANGAIGKLLSQMLPSFGPSRLLLVGRADEPGQTMKRERLEALRNEISMPGGEVIVSQDVNDCRLYKCNLVIAATNDLNFLPSATAEGTLVLDIAAPNACLPHPDWAGKLVYLAGCGQFDPAALSEYFGKYNGELLRRVVGKDGELWGCMVGGIYDHMFGEKGHVVGETLNPEALVGCTERFKTANLRPQRRSMFGRVVGRKEECRFVSSMVVEMRPPLLAANK